MIATTLEGQPIESLEDALEYGRKLALSDVYGRPIYS